MLRFEDEIRGHKHFRDAAGRAAAVYLALHDADVAEAARAAAAPAAGASEEDEKRAKALAKREKAKQRKAAAKLAKADAAPAATAAADDKGGGASNKKGANAAEKKPEDDDPNGEKLAAKPPLEEALRLSRALDKYAASFVATQALAVDVALRRKKPLVALRALRRLKKLDERAFVEKLALLAAARPRWTEAAKPVENVLDAELADLCGGQSAAAACRAFGMKRTRLPDRAACYRALATLGAADASLVLTAETAPPAFGKPLAVTDFEDALAALSGDAAAAERFKAEVARPKFPTADAFAPPGASA